MAWIGETHEDTAHGTLKDAYARIVRALGRVIPFYRAYSVTPRIYTRTSTSTSASASSACCRSAGRS